MAKYKIALSMGLALILVAAWERPSAVAQKGEESARAFDRNGEAFGTKNLDDFVRKAHAFVESPPTGTQRVTRPNGDTLLYDPKGDIFALVTKAGSPRTILKPDDGPAYWEEQKVSMTRRQASRADGARANTE